MNEEIKIGDEVICINRKGTMYLKKGKTYKVHDISYPGNDIYIESRPNDFYWYQQDIFIKKDIEQDLIELW